MNTANLISPSQALKRIKPKVIDNKSNTVNKDKIVQHGYSIGQYHFLIKKLTQAEIIDNTTIYPIPKSHTSLRGLINSRGSLIPVFDLKVFLNLENSEKEHILVLGKEENAVAILTDSLPSQPSINKKMQQSPPINDTLKEYISDTYMDEKNNVWLDFDYEKFFSDLAKNI